MDPFWLKLVLTPLLIGSASLAGRRFGPAAGGWLVGLPLTSGPIAFFLALERGAGFATVAAEGTLLGLVSVAAFCLAYGRLAPRASWPATLLVGLAAFLGATLMLRQINFPIPLSSLAVAGLLAGVLLLLPRTGTSAEATTLPSWDLPARMVVATAFVVLLTRLADVLGPRLSGLLAPLPIFAGVLAVFVHLQQGGDAAANSVRGTLVGSFAFAAFFAVLVALLEPAGVITAFAGATLTALAMQGVSLRWLKAKSGG